jgi:hypothetical protein
LRCGLRSGLTPLRQLIDQGSDGLRHIVVLQRVGSLDGRELRGLTPPISEEKLGRPNPVGLADKAYRSDPDPSAIASNISTSLVGSRPHLWRIALAIPLGRPPGFPDCPGFQGRRLLTVLSGLDHGEMVLAVQHHGIERDASSDRTLW